MQTLVIAHAAFGHNHFFKNNYLFRQWTDADGILDYLDFAKGYIADCEERYGHAAVERAARRRACADEPRRPPLSAHAAPDLRDRGEARARAPPARGAASTTISGAPCPAKGARRPSTTARGARAARCCSLPQENILYFLEKTAPRLQPWQREMLRIVRHIAQYFYPQRQTKVMNEGCATYVHYRIMNAAARAGAASTDGACLEFLHSHTNVVFQPDFDDPPLFRHQPLCARLRHDAATSSASAPSRPRRTATGSRTSPAAAIPMAVLRDVWANYRDESFILQFLSPRADPQAAACSTSSTTASEHDLRVEAIHDERGYRRIRARAGAAVRRRAGTTPTSRSSMST